MSTLKVAIILATTITLSACKVENEEKVAVLENAQKTLISDYLDCKVAMEKSFSNTSYLDENISDEEKVSSLLSLTSARMLCDGEAFKKYSNVIDAIKNTK